MLNSTILMEQVRSLLYRTLESPVVTIYSLIPSLSPSLSYEVMEIKKVDLNRFLDVLTTLMT